MSGGAAGPCAVRSAWGAMRGPPLSAALRVVREEEEGRAGGRGPGDGVELVRLCRPCGEEQQQQQGSSSSSCTVELSCSGHELLVAAVSLESEARTVELYAEGEYVGSARGQPLPGGGPYPDNGEEVNLYKTHICLEFPSPSCELKLMSLGDKEYVRIRTLTVLVRERGALGGAVMIPGVTPTVDMDRVCSMMESMGATLSPGAQSLMGLVQQHQQNRKAAGSTLQGMLMAGFCSPLGGVDVASMLKLGMAAANAAGATRGPALGGALPSDALSRSLHVAPSEDCREPPAPGDRNSPALAEGASGSTRSDNGPGASNGTRPSPNAAQAPRSDANAASACQALASHAHQQRKRCVENEEGEPADAEATPRSPGHWDDPERTRGDSRDGSSLGKWSDEANVGARPVSQHREDRRQQGPPPAPGGGAGSAEDARSLERLLLARVEESERRLMGFVDLRLQALQAHIDAQFTAVRRLIIDSVGAPKAAGETRSAGWDSVPN
ncbi:ATPase PAAT isoform X2 [Lethenteron reissneri]|uniref:ATPase PAAT isoform X2 n=1 Tax=Lethenteron reissneri TaxID=7753 RepID=UPI002AB6498E|nr:ATPase PAAT isoform X2 [Lethenteron reissneri]